MRAGSLLASSVVVIALGAMLSAQRPGTLSGAGTAAPGQQAGRAVPPRDRAPVPWGSASINGRVVAADSGRPLRLAQVRLTSPAAGGPPRAAVTDANGEFVFAGLPAGSYRISASKSGYIAQDFGQLRTFESGTPIDLGDGEHRERVNFALSKGGAISGRIIDESGDGVAQARVEALRLQYTANGPDVVPAGTSGPTDDLGQYRVYGLPPGEYLVRTSNGNMPLPGMNDQFRMNPVLRGRGENAPRENYAPTYYPGVVNLASAQTIPLDAGQEASASFSVPIVRFARISGTVIDSEGRPFTAGAINLRSVNASVNIVGASAGIAAGAFEFSNVAPGEYILDFRSNFFKERNNAVEVAALPVFVDGIDISGLVVTAHTGGAVSGRIVLEGSARLDASKVNINVVRAGGASRGPSPNSFTMAADGSFQIRGLSGAVLFRPVVPQPGWALKAVRAQGRDLTDVPYDFQGGENLSGVEIVLTDRVATVAGTVRDASGQPVKDYAVVMLPDSLPRDAVPNRFVRTLRPDREGRVSARGIPPGSYLVAALPSVGQSREWDPQFQAMVRNIATRLTIAEGQAATLDLVVSQF